MLNVLHYAWQQAMLTLTCELLPLKPSRVHSVVLTVQAQAESNTPINTASGHGA